MRVYVGACACVGVLKGNLYNYSMALRRNLIKFQLRTQIKINLGDAPPGCHYLRLEHLLQTCIYVGAHT